MEDEVAALVSSMLVYVHIDQRPEQLDTGYRQWFRHVQGWLYVPSPYPSTIQVGLLLFTVAGMSLKNIVCSQTSTEPR